MGYLVFLFVGLLLGWSLPQPQWANTLVEKIKLFFTNKGEG